METEQQQASEQPQQETSGASEQSQSIEQATTEQEAPLSREVYGGPLSLNLMRRLSERMDQFFEDVFGSAFGAFGRFEESTWWPQIDVSQQGNKLTVHADLPGLSKDDVKVEIRHNALQISGERRAESERKTGAYYRSERSYGSFLRTIPLPEGSNPDTASAKFENGVLKVEVETPVPQSSARRIEVREGSAH